MSKSLEDTIKELYFNSYPLEDKTKEIREELKKIKDMPKKVIQQIDNFLDELKEQKEQKNNVKIVAWAWDFGYLLPEDDHPRHSVYMTYIINKKFKKVGFCLSGEDLKEQHKGKNNECG